MSEAQWISPVRIIDTTLLGVSFDIDEDFSNEEVDLSFTINFSSGEFEELELENEFACRYIFEIILTWKIKESRKKAYGASCKVGIYISIPNELLQDFNKTKKRQYLSANAVSLAYGKIRSTIESITAETPVGKQIIPTIAPYEFLSSLTPTEE